MPEGLPTASVVIVTRNRKDDLRRALRSVLSQDVPTEVIVIDDASTDGTPDMVRREFPGIRLEESTTSKGACFQRNRASELVSGEYIVTIDDDAELPSPLIVRQTLADFDHPRVAAVSIPHKDILISPELKTPVAPAPGKWVVSGFVATAGAFRRDVFLQLGGYRAELEIGTEERDFCSRLLDFGYVTRLGTADPILHYASPVRDVWRRRMLERRNDVCHAIWNVPMPHLLYHLPGTILSGLRYGLTHGCLQPTVAGYWQAIPLICRTLRLRDPIAGRIYRLLRRLNRHGVLPFEEVCAVLGPPGQRAGRRRESNPMP